jgi:hypothetical protein
MPPIAWRLHDSDFGKRFKTVAPCRRELQATIPAKALWRL